MSVAEIEAREVQLERPGGALARCLAPARSATRRDRGIRHRRDLRIVALFAPLIAQYGPPRAGTQSARRARAAPAPRASTCSGVDELGRDEFSRVVYGARYSLLIGVVSVAVGLTIGIMLGAAAGYLGGWVDTVIMRLMDIMLAIPGFLLAIGIVARARARPDWQIMIAVGVVNVPIFARLLRGSVLAHAGDGLRARGARGRRQEAGDPRRAHPPELGLARDRPGDARARDGDHRRRRPRLPRPRPAGPVDARVGDDAHRHDALPPDRAVPRADPGCGDRHVRARLQPDRRRAPRGARPEAARAVPSDADPLLSRSTT